MFYVLLSIRDLGSQVSASATSVQIVRDTGDVLASPPLVGVKRGADNYVKIEGKVGLSVVFDFSSFEIILQVMTVIVSPRILKRGGICASLVIPRGAVESACCLGRRKRRRRWSISV